MAAGMGSRYGGIKQIDGFGPSGETIMDYSLFDCHPVGIYKSHFYCSGGNPRHRKGNVFAKLKGKYKLSLLFNR